MDHNDAVGAGAAAVHCNVPDGGHRWSAGTLSAGGIFRPTGAWSSAGPVGDRTEQPNNCAGFRSSRANVNFHMHSPTAIEIKCS